MKKIIMANWKMNLSILESLELAKELQKKIKTKKKTVVLFPDFSTLAFIGPIIKDSQLLLGAQDSAAFEKGAHTGEVQPGNLKMLGVSYVLIGHSERRKELSENISLLNKKIKTALSVGLIPVLCLGEDLNKKKAGLTKKYLKTELSRVLKDVKIKKASDLILAYEPAWAISTSIKAKPLDSKTADSIHEFLKKEVKKITGFELKVIYGGSVNSSNSISFLNQNNIDGLLIGSASLKADSFMSIAN